MSRLYCRPICRTRGAARYGHNRARGTFPALTRQFPGEVFDRQAISLRQRIWAVRAITLSPGVADSADLEHIPEPPESHGSILVRSLALGVCGTDREIVSGLYGEAPPGNDRLVLGHESFGEVIEAPRGSRFMV